jgi:hypothetical protein
MDKMGPAKYWCAFRIFVWSISLISLRFLSFLRPDYEGCFHPGVVGGDDSGAMVVLEQFYKSFWKAELGC